MPEEKQESRTMIINLRVTPSEKYRIAWVAGVKGVDVSELLREMSIGAILQEHKRISELVSAGVT